MATIKLTPSTYYFSNSTYLQITNASNMYTDVSSDTYATITNTRTSTTNYYTYIRGFNFDAIPDGAVINSFTVRIKGRATGAYNSSLYLCNGTSTLANTTATQLPNSTSTATRTLSNGALTWENIVSYGDNFGIRIHCRRNARNTQSYYYIYGAEIEVDYTLPTYYTIAATSSVSGITLSPATQSILEGGSATITIPVDDISGYVLTDNNVDVTSSAVRYAYEGSSGSPTFIPASFDEANSSYDSVYNNYGPSNGLTNHTSSTRCCVYSNTGASAASYLYYNFDCSSIPANAIISSVTCQAGAACYSSGQYFATKDLQLCVGTTAKGTATTITGNGSTNTSHNINGGTSWTRAELNNLKLRVRIIRTTSDTTADASFSFWGATLTVNYTTPSTGHYYTYTINNIQATHAVLLEETVYIPPEEDPTYTYWPITISSINAETNPSTGTIRVVEGTNQTITISPTDPLLTLALDNGVDITSQLVGGTPNNTYTVTTQVSGASYGFPLNASTYYTSNNAGVSESAAVCRVNFNFETSCLVTIQYINYAEATYDYGIFGQIDTALSTAYNNTSGGYYTCSQSSDNTSTPQTLTYTIPAGTHYIDIKYLKDNYTNSNNDNLQWKIIDITPTGAGADYTYTLTNVNQKHSLIFVFGDVTYYFITSSSTNGARLFPDGQQVKLPGDNYTLNIVPDDTTATVTITDNGVDVSSSLQQEVGVDKNNNTVISYRYKLMNIQATHTLLIQIGEQTIILYYKDGTGWHSITKAYKKINGSWVEQLDLTTIFNNNNFYKQG